MQNNDTDNNSTSRMHRRPMEKMSYANKGRFFKIRNILNIVFILLAIIGMVIYLYSNHFIGGAILIASIIIKFSESVLRIMH